MDPPGLRDGPAEVDGDGSREGRRGGWRAAVTARLEQERQDGERDHRDAESGGADDVHGSA